MIEIAKPPHGSPCNSCGFCCTVELCPLGEAIFGDVAGPCPALQPAGDGRWECGAIIAPGAFRLAATVEYGPDEMSGSAAYLLGAGQGCDCHEEGEAFDLIFDLLISAECETPKGTILGAAAQVMWGMI